MVTVVPGGIPNSGQHGALFSPILGTTASNLADSSLMSVLESKGLFPSCISPCLPHIHYVHLSHSPRPPLSLREPRSPHPDTQVTLLCQSWPPPGSLAPEHHGVSSVSLHRALQGGLFFWVLPHGLLSHRQCPSVSPPIFN